MKKYLDGYQEPTDMPSYAYSHYARLRKTNSVDDSVKLVFADLTSEEISTSFV